MSDCSPVASTAPSTRSASLHSSQQRRAFHSAAATADAPSPLPSTLLRPSALPVRTVPIGKAAPTPTRDPPYQAAVIQKLAAMPRQELLAALGEGPADCDSTPCLRDFHAQIAAHNLPYREALRLELVRLAIRIDHPRYTKRDLYKAYQALCLTGHPVSPAHSLKILDALLLHHTPPRARLDPANLDHLRLPDADINLALKLLAHISMRQGSSSILRADVLARLHHATAFQVPVYLAPAPGREQQRASVFEEHAVPVPRAAFKAVLARQSRVRKIMRVAFAEFGAAEFPALLRMHFFQAQFDLFWDIWRRRALMRVPRGKAEYLVLFRVMAERANEKLIMQMLDEAVPMMEREAVPVRLDAELAQALMRCLVVVEPGVRGRLHADGLTPAHGPVFALWDRCMRAVLEGQDAAQQESQTVR